MTDSTSDAGIDPTAAIGAAREFVTAVAWGEHRTVWELLSSDGRKTVLRVGVNHGLDEALAARLRDGTAGKAESEDFLVQLVLGLRADLRGADLDTLEYTADPAPEPGRARVVLESPLPGGLDALGSALPVGSLELVDDGGGEWRVERLVPNVTPG